MKKLTISVIFSLLLITQVNAQTVDEILANYFETIGQDKLLETETFTTKGKIIQGQFEIPFTSHSKRPMKYRMDASFQGMEIASAFDGEKGWNINPFAGQTDPVPMTAEELDRMKMEADYVGIYYNYEEKGYTVEFSGTEDVDDIETYKLKLTRPSGDVITSYIDSENYVILKTTSKIKVQGVDTEAETVFSNYKYVDEILNPFAIETKMNGETVVQMVFDEITYNVDFQDSIFEMPEVTAPADSLSETQDDTAPVDSTDSE
jgi:outer membrane lipoprotein-sorting protein